MTIASRLKLNIWLSMAVVFMTMTAFGAAIIIENDIRERSLFADQLMRGVFELSLITDYYIRHPGERPKTQWQHKQASLLQLLKERRYKQAEKVRLELINQSLSDLGALFDELTGTYVSGRPDETIARQKREQLADLIIMRSRAIAETTARMATESRTEIAAVTRRIAVAFTVLSLMVLAITIWSATSIRKSITGPIEQLRQGAAIIGTGQLDYRIGLASADELGQLTGEFDQMARRLKTITASRDELSQEVAERQQAEQLLRIKEAELSEAQRLAHIGSWHWDAKTDVTTGSDELLRIYDFDPATQAMPNFKEQRGRCYPVEDWERVNAAVQRSVETGVGYELDVRAIRNDTMIWITTRSEAVRDAEGRIVGLRGTVQDITERKRAEAALQESEQRLNRAQEIAHLGSWELDLVNNVLIWSDEVYRIFGLRPQEFGATYEAFLERVHPDDRPAVDAAYTGSLRENRDTYEIEHRVVCQDTAEIRIVHEKCEHFRDATGRIIRSVGMIHDITERKRAAEVLRESEARLQLAQQVAHIGTFEWNIQTGVNCWTPELEAMYGLPPGGFPGTQAAWEQLVYADDRPEAVRRVQEALEQGGFEGEWRVHWPDGTVRWLAGRAWVFKDEAGQPLRLLGVNIDITERKQAEVALTKRTEELARSNKDLEQFAYVASHDLQEPLRAVAGCVQLLQKRYQGQLDERADEFIAHAVEGAERMRQLIDDLLAFSRVGTRGGPLQPVDSGAALAAALANLTVAIHESGAVITHDLLPSVTADPTQLTLLLQNLIGNAIKFRREGSPRIHVGAQRQGHHWVLSVRDNGIGIEPQYFERIFGVFQRLHTRREYAGTGIGLAICKKIVERHGGRIWVESVPGAGCTFYCSLPDGQ